MSQAEFDSLPRFDARDFAPPAWATGSDFDWDLKPGQGPPIVEQGQEAEQDESDDDNSSWKTPSEGVSLAEHDEMTAPELKAALDQATALKFSGNKSFTAKPPNVDAALSFYQRAEAVLVICPVDGEETPPAPPASSGLQEITDDEATLIEAENASSHASEDQAKLERKRLVTDIRECLKACYGNQGACFLAREENKDAVDACSKALKIDPHFVKALRRRATANERLSTWSSLTSAQEVKLLPHDSPISSTSRKALVTLPERIRMQQEKEKDEMLGKLKELGNGLLGKFGLSTDMFKFEQQEGGGYNMRFER